MGYTPVTENRSKKGSVILQSRLVVTGLESGEAGAQ